MMDFVLFFNDYIRMKCKGFEKNVLTRRLS